MINRRSLITGLISLVAAPAIVRAGSLMPVKTILPRYIAGDPGYWLLHESGQNDWTGSPSEWEAKKLEFRTRLEASMRSSKLIFIGTSTGQF